LVEAATHLEEIKKEKRMQENNPREVISKEINFSQFPVRNYIANIFNMKIVKTEKLLGVLKLSFPFSSTDQSSSTGYATKILLIRNSMDSPTGMSYLQNQIQYYN